MIVNFFTTQYLLGDVLNGGANPTNSEENIARAISWHPSAVTPLPGIYNNISPLVNSSLALCNVI